MVWLRFADESRVHAGFSTLVVILQMLFSPVFTCLAGRGLVDRRHFGEGRQKRLGVIGLSE
jgi:hypothetical protein